MHKSTKEILNRRVPSSIGWNVEEIADLGIVITANDLDGKELYSVTVDEETRSYAAGKVKPPFELKYRTRDWRELLYCDAIEFLKDKVGRLKFPALKSLGQVNPLSGIDAPPSLPKRWTAVEAPGFGVIISAHLLGGETAHVTVDEATRQFSLGIVKPYCTKIQIEDVAEWRSQLYAAAIESLMEIASDRAKCVILGSDSIKNAQYISRALRFGMSRLIVIGNRHESMSELESICNIEYYPPGTEGPKGDVALFDAR